MTKYILLFMICISSTVQIVQAQFCCASHVSLTSKINDTINIPDIGNIAVFDYKYWVNDGSDTTGYICYDWDDLEKLDKRLSLAATKDFVTNYLLRKLTHLSTDTFVKWKVMYTTDCYKKTVCTIKAMLAVAFTCCDKEADLAEIAKMAYKVPYDTIPNFIDFYTEVKCGKKCCYVDFTVKKTKAYDYTPPRPYLAIERMKVNGQLQQPGIEVYGCPTSSTQPHCAWKDSLGVPIPVKCEAAGCGIR